MPVTRDELPVSECLGVLFGVLGIDWLANGKAHILLAIGLALGFGAVVMLVRYWKTHRKHP